MKLTTARRFIFAAMLLGMFVISFSSAFAAQERWAKYTPTAEQTEISVSNTDTGRSVTVTFTFPNSGYYVEWGENVTINGNEIIVQADAYDWTGASMMMITTIEKTYDISILTQGTYNVSVYSHNKLVKTTSSTVQ